MMQRTDLDPGSPARHDAVRQLLVDTAAAPDPSRHSRRVVIPAVVAGAVVLTGSGFAWSALRPDAAVSDKSSASCYTIASYHAGDPVPGTLVAEATREGASQPGEVSNALSACSALFRQGFLKVGDPTEIYDPTPGKHPVPRLVACVLPDGTAAVFPGETTTCKQFGLRPAR